MVHRFGGSYGPARFWLTAGKAREARIRLTMVNGAGVPISVWTLKDIVIEESPPELVREVEIAGAQPRPGEPGSAVRVFRWVHLSDLQSRSRSLREEPRISADIAELFPGQRIDAVIVTGDRF
jgi:hypothetical protein